MLLDLSKAFSFLLSIVSLYAVTISAFFEPGTRWRERLIAAAIRLLIAGCICFISGLLFTWPSRSNPDADEPLLKTLPVRMFFWATAVTVILFATNSYLVCGNPFSFTLLHNCT